jgi:hypothetical protein
VCVREKLWRDSEVGTKRERTGMGRKEKIEGAGGDARIVRRETIEHMRRNEREGEKGTGRNMERRRQGDG